MLSRIDATAYLSRLFAIHIQLAKFTAVANAGSTLPAPWSMYSHSLYQYLQRKQAELRKYHNLHSKDGKYAPQNFCCRFSPAHCHSKVSRKVFATVLLQPVVVQGSMSVPSCSITVHVNVISVSVSLRPCLSFDACGTQQLAHGLRGCSLYCLG